MALGEQAAVGYGGTAVRDLITWMGHAAQEYWYYAVGGVVLLLLLWGYSRK